MKPFALLARARLATFVRLGTWLSCLSIASAQSTLIVSFGSDETPLDQAGGLPSQAEILPGELVSVTPDASTSYSAHSFLTYDAQWAYLGDADNDGAFVDQTSATPGTSIDAVFAKRYPAQPSVTGPRSVYISTTTSDDLPAGIEDGAVFRFEGDGQVDVFLSESQLRDAFSSHLFGGDVDLEAICQDDAGNLYVGASIQFGSSRLELFLISNSALVYDADGNVLSVAPSSAVMIAGEQQFCSWITISGVRSEDGMTLNGTSSLCGSFFSTLASISVDALELDPSGGTWTSFATGAQHPNLMFSVSSERTDGALISTRNGGSIPSVNGMPMASLVATTGAQIGLLPGNDGVSWVRGLALVPETRALTIENWPTSVVPATGSSNTRQEVGGATPGGNVIFFYDRSDNSLGAASPITALGSAFTGALFGDGMFQLNGIVPADTSGYASLLTPFPAGVLGSNAYVVLQAYDITSRTFSSPSTLDFQ